MGTHRKKIQEVDAFKVGTDEIPGWFNDMVTAETAEIIYSTPPTIDHIEIDGPDGLMVANPTDYILREPAESGYLISIYTESFFELNYDTNPNSLEGRLGQTAFTNEYPHLDQRPTIPASPVNADWNAGSGLAEILNKPGHLSKRVEVYSGSTNGSGNYTVTFGTAYPSPPYVVPTIPNQSSVNQYVRVTAVSTTGFTVHAYGFQSLLGALQLGSSNLTSLAVEVLVREK